MIKKCDPESVYFALMEAATLGLDPSIKNSCHFIPYGNKLTLRVGYRTMLDWVENTEKVLTINTQCVYKGEVFELVGGLDPTINHIISPEIEKNWENLLYVYSVALMKSGGKIWKYLDKKQIQARRGVSKTSEFWTKWPIEMTEKTSLINLCKFLPMSTEQKRQVDKFEHHNTWFEYDNPDLVEPEQVTLIGAEDEADKVLGPK